MAYALAHKGKATASEVTYNPADGPEAYTSASVHSKLSEYTSAAHERHGRTSIRPPSPWTQTS